MYQKCETQVWGAITQEIVQRFLAFVPAICSEVSREKQGSSGSFHLVRTAPVLEFSINVRLWSIHLHH